MPVNIVQDLVSTLNAHRVLVYSLLSTVTVSAAIANALKQQSNFYAIMIHLSKSNRSVLILVNFGFLVALLCAHIAQQIFFGPLRAPEIERLYDRLWFFVTESLLAFTIFRDEFDIPFALMFGFLLFIKSFHWLAADRIEWMDQRPYPGPPPLFHFRMSALFVLLWGIDCLMFLIAAEHTLTNGVGGMVLFASEYAILMATALNAIAKYMLSLYEIRRASQRGGENAPPWENKSMWTFYIELSTDFLKLTTYLVFFAVIITFYGLPLNIIRDVYITARSFIGRLRALHRYQTATRNMDQRYPNATPEELSAMNDRTCIICREEMSAESNVGVQQGQPGQAPIPTLDGPNTTPKKLPCGHIFHFNCLRAWLERQQNCPTCRRTVLDNHQQGQPGPVVGAPAPRQPGAFIQQPIPFGNAGIQPGQQAPNNPPGFLGRILGYANQPVIVPGQFPQFPGANGNNMRHYYNAPLNPGQFPQGIMVQYNIQLQPPRHPQQQPLSNTQPPTPRFAGFQGPAGAWQPWGMDQRWFLLDNVAQAPNHPAGTTPFSPGVSPTPFSNTGATTPAPESQRRSLPAQSTPAAQNFPERPSEPELRGPQATDSRTDPGASHISVEPQEHSSDGPEPSASTTPVESLPTTPSHIPNTEQPRLKIPTLIPLFDYRPTPANPLSHSSPQRPNIWPRRSSTSVQNVQTFRHPETQPGAQQTQPRPTAPQLPVSDAHRTYPTTSQLPPTLTEEQLAVMDNLTREAIDERLRVLEGVSEAISRCTNDLLRMRSVLPRSSATPRLHMPSPINSQDQEILTVVGTPQAPPTTREPAQLPDYEKVVPSESKSPERPNSEGLVDDSLTPHGDPVAESSDDV